eukprot:TRINITY_DN112191_c0_g1_i1.p1 TRINITY_DN112191_c0_g1~~TRINITY_DN112191_c0_g1_i1.p1  ORF type:complete len:135 (+),score=21.52 TRINITY_DN112191_c0_g1_i1:43-405(+)
MSFSPPENDAAEPLWRLEFKNGIAQFMDGGMGLCLITCCFPCVTAGQVAAGVDKPCFLWGFLSWLPGCGPYFRALTRKDVQIKQGISKGTFCEDVLIHYSISCCALIQEHRELGLGGESQ